ncbi:molecular chaperone HtpG [Marinicella sp. S1101]|uniref:molecular chaperone HtpG n=1 Tax=Marinicella marina TaxID=2996016 RepID=UPI0022609C6B|nr:molecular chaperone HtpG [Marinicella marina]MCX7552921.1 molecular chaperone HtpG [Marinicella marina]MDJ1139770.1 molecular chaperone HtpG [Marinicella marina]
MTQTAEKFEFQAEVNQVLDLVIHSLYSNKEIFLRELISNASDACDKLRFEAIKNPALMSDDLHIKVDFEDQAKTVTITDNGIGMTRDEVINNIGTIANSGTKKYLESIAKKDRDDANLIGQFGVGFYASFIVADEVEIRTLKAGEATDHAVSWKSDGKNAYTLENITKETQGTEIILHLREEEVEFADNFRLRSLIKKYSEHVAFPIKMLEVTHPEKDDEGNEIPAKTPEYEVVNDATALWKKSPGDVKDEDYQAFYKQISNDFNDAAFWSHNHIEGTQSYSNLLYVPSKSPFNMFSNPDERDGLKLFIKRVFIMDAAKELMPNYLRFVKGVVDSNDLPLNVSREILQDNPLLQKIKSGLVKRVLGMLKKKSLDADVYANFWQEFGDTLKEGVVEDFANREAVLKLLRFASTNNEDATENVSLDDYIERMQDKQDKIYYITGESYEAVKNSPHLELFKKEGVEVLLMHSRIDEWMMGHVQEYADKKFQSVAKGKLDLGQEDKKDKEPSEADKSFLEKVQKHLSKHVSEVTASSRLVDSASCLVMDEHAMAIHMQKLMEQAGQAMPGQLPALEINLDHPLVQHIEHIDDENHFKQWSELLYEQALLAEGGQLKNPADYVQKMNQLMLDILK